MRGRAQYSCQRKNCAEFDSEAKNGSSNYFQFVPAAPECVDNILSIRARWLTDF